MQFVLGEARLLLEAFDVDSAALSLTELSRRSGVAKAATHRLANALVEWGVLERAGTKYRLAHAVYKPVALPFEDKAPWKNEYDREQAAWTRLTSTITMGATLGTLVGGLGGLGGGAVGCVLGGIAGATVAAATIVGLFGAFIPAAAIGCLGGIIAVGALGTLAGQLLVTGPVAIGAAIQYLATVNQPPVRRRSR
jgi:hypothetical protein